MVLWGLTVGLVVALVLLEITPLVWPTNDARGIKLRDSMLVLEHGGPLLLGRHGPRGPLYPVDFGDDAGAFVYIPLLTRIFGVGDPVTMYRYIYVVLVSAAASIYPAMFCRLTRSLLAGIAAPLMLVVCLLSMGFCDIYWIPAWGALTLLPPIYLLARKWPRLGLPALIAISLAAGLMSSIRSDSGLGIAIAAAIVLLLRRWRWWRILPSLLVLALAYISINTFVISPIRANRDHRLAEITKKVDFTAAHTLWHTAYAGFGYLPNKYGLRFADDVPAKRVQREAPGTPFLSRHYEAVIKKAYFNLLREHPAEAIRQYVAKAVVVIADTFPYTLIALVTLPVMLLIDPDRRVARQWILLTVPAGIMAFLPIMLAVPIQVYEQGLYGVIGVADITGLCWMLRQVETATRKSGEMLAIPTGPSRLRTALIRHWRPRWQTTRVSILATAVLIALTFAGYFIRQDANRWQGARAGVLMEHVRV